MKIRWTRHDIKTGAMVKRGGTTELYLIAFLQEADGIKIGIVDVRDGMFVVLGSAEGNEEAKKLTAAKLNEGSYAPVMKLDCAAGEVGHNIFLEVGTTHD